MLMILQFGFLCSQCSISLQSPAISASEDCITKHAELFDPRERVHFADGSIKVLEMFCRQNLPTKSVDKICRQNLPTEIADKTCRQKWATHA
jgi:hypothetical protein